MDRGLLIFAFLGLIGLVASWIGGLARTPWRASCQGAMGSVWAAIVIGLMLSVPLLFTILPLLLLLVPLGALIGLLLGPLSFLLRRYLGRRVWLAGMALCGGLILLMVVRAVESPHYRASVPWPDERVEVAIKRGNWWTDRWSTRVRTPHGRLNLGLWDNWGPADRANLYRTPGGSLAVIGGGDLAAIITIPADAPPQPASRDEIATGSEWVYLGAVLGTQGGVRFAAPSELGECIALYGAGSVPVRKEFQRSDSGC